MGLFRQPTRWVDLAKGESFGFLGFDFRRVWTLRGVWGVRYAPKMKARTALLQKIKDVFRRFRSRPVDRVVDVINPVLNGWVNYFRIGHSRSVFRVCEGLGREEDKATFDAGTPAWGLRLEKVEYKAWLYGQLGLFANYRVVRL